jgi:acetyltransferase-like isoleucine patch superfamily enzyme
MDYFKHKTAIVEKGARIGKNTKIWHFTHIREGAIIGKDCIIGKGVYIDKKVIMGNSCKIQNSVNIYQGVEIGHNVFVGPSSVFTNVKYPKSPQKDWQNEIERTIIEKGVSIGANCTILCGVRIGSNSMIGAGTVVTKDIAPNKIVYDKKNKIIKERNI